MSVSYSRIRESQRVLPAAGAPEGGQLPDSALFTVPPGPAVVVSLNQVQNQRSLMLRRSNLNRRALKPPSVMAALLCPEFYGQVARIR